MAHWITLITGDHPVLVLAFDKQTLATWRIARPPSCAACLR